ncbi:MarR family winged helix-turn-helix transcriptional regulator [Rhizobium sp. Rhizsp82]|uniref:MarR family winged helix-turn-helix transcriptional regulator n=1 Tax=Rhizobium sp. Rhizsp82 TaxID=3243057 RepID=UPI0039B69AEF
MSVAADHPAAHCGSLGRMLGLDKSTFGRSLGPLERAKLIELTRDEHDKRARFVHITKSGELALTRAHVLWNEAEDTFLSLIGPACSEQSRSVASFVTSRLSAVETSRIHK